MITRLSTVVLTLAVVAAAAPCAQAATIIGNWGFDEGSGTVVYDSATGGTASPPTGQRGTNNGILVTGLPLPGTPLPAWSTDHPVYNGVGVGTGSLQFDGSISHGFVQLESGTSGLPSGASMVPALGCKSFTVMAWVKRTGRGADVSSGSGGVLAEPIVCKGRNDNDGGNYDMNWVFGFDAVNNGGLYLVADIEDYNSGGNHPITYTSGTQLVESTFNNVWHHVAVTYNSDETNSGSGTAQWKLYLDGALYGSKDLTGLTLNQRLPRYDSIHPASVGAALRRGQTDSADRSGAFKGFIDEVKVYDGVLTQTEIQGAMPEPATLGLLAVGGLLALRRRHR